MIFFVEKLKQAKKGNKNNSNAVDEGDEDDESDGAEAIQSGTPHVQDASYCLNSSNKIFTE